MFRIATVPASPDAAELNDRMQLILDQQDLPAWNRSVIGRQLVID